MNFMAIGIIIGMPIGIITWVVSGYLRDKCRIDKNCEMCGGRVLEVWNIDICKRCIDRFEEETKKRLSGRMLNSFKEDNNAK